MQPHPLTKESEAQRLEAFSDGVFAIAITLLVLEIHVPETPEGNLRHALLSLWPSYFGYVFSFLMIGIYWVSHHYIFKLYKRTDQMFLLLNVLFLMCISFLPFPTSILARWITDPHQCKVAIFMYALGLFLPAFSWLLMWLYASQNHRLLDKRLEQRCISHLTRWFIIANTVYVIAMMLLLWNGIGQMLIYLLPMEPPVYHGQER